MDNLHTKKKVHTVNSRKRIVSKLKKIEFGFWIFLADLIFFHIKKYGWKTINRNIQ